MIANDDYGEKEWTAAKPKQVQGTPSVGSLWINAGAKSLLLLYAAQAIPCDLAFLLHSPKSRCVIALDTFGIGHCVTGIMPMEQFG